MPETSIVSIKRQKGRGVLAEVTTQYPHRTFSIPKESLEDAHSFYQASLKHGRVRVHGRAFGDGPNAPVTKGQQRALWAAMLEGK